MFAPSRRMSWLAKVFLTGCVACIVAATLGGTAFAQNEWNGSANSVFYDGSNWGSGVPTAGGSVRIGNVAFTNAPVFTGTGVNPGNFTINGNTAGSFTMQSGTLTTSAGFFRVGDTNNSGTATFNMNGGLLTVNGDFRTANVSGAKAVFNMSSGTIQVNSVNSGQEVNFCSASLGANSPGTITTGTITGGALISNGRIRFGRSNSNSTTAQNPQAIFTMTGGLLQATGAVAPTNEDAGTMNFLGGRIDLQGGTLRSTDVSSASGFNKFVENGNTGGLILNGGVFEVIANRSEGTLWVIPPGTVDPFLDVVPSAIQRGMSRTLGMAYGYQNDPVGPRAYTNLPNSTVRCYMSTDPVSGKQQANIFASNYGDYNLDGVVDQSDYNVWSSQLNYQFKVNITATTSGDAFIYYGADGNGDGQVTGADYTVWAARVGERTVGGIYRDAQDRTIDVSSGSQTQSSAGYASLNFINTKALTKTGAGTLVLDGSNSYTYNTTVSAGTLQIANSGAFTLASSTVTVQPGATLKVDSGVTMMSPRVEIAGGTLDGTAATISVNAATGVKNLVIGAGGSVIGSPAVVVSNTGSVTISNSTPQTVNVQSLTVDTATGGKVDLGRGTVNIASGSAAAIVAAIVQGRNDGAWNGASGISSAAAAAGGGNRAVGWVDNGGGSFTVAFGGAGDVNLNGVVDFDDVVQVLSANLYDTGLPANWADGDYDYNGVYDFDDVVAAVGANLYDTGPYNTAPGLLGGASLVGGSIAAVPEPATWVLVAMGAACAAGRSLRRRSMLRA